MSTLAKPPHAYYAHPDAVAQARALEAHAYTEVQKPEDLDDGEDLMLVDHASGRMAPGRYHRFGDDVDHLGRRTDHILEIYPGSEYSDTLPYSKTLRTTPEGESVSRIGMFRPTKPEHALHGAHFYDARERLSRGDDIGRP